MEVCLLFSGKIIVNNFKFLEESQRKKKLDDALVKMIATDLQPISIVNNQGFQDFLKVIDSKYVPPSRRTITRDLIPKLHSTCKSQFAVFI